MLTGYSMKNKLLICITCTVISASVIYKFLDYYIFTINVHVPIIGYVDTGITKYQLKQFEVAEREYKVKEQQVYSLYRRNVISSQDLNDRLAKINFERLSDPRITAVIGGPAKSALKFLMDIL